MLHQLSYEATDVGSRSIMLSYIPVKEMSVNDIWNKSYMNCGNEWKWRNDRRSERNLCNCVKKPSGLQRGLNLWPRDTGVMLYQLSYEATDVGSRSLVGSYVPVKEMSVNDVWNTFALLKPPDHQEVIFNYSFTKFVFNFQFE